MFENYSSSVQIGHNCGCHSSSNIRPEQFTPARVTKDELGNITKLQWAPDARFTINLTSDTSVSIIEGSQILNKSGADPLGIAGWEGLHAYNLIDAICWKFSNGTWNRLPEIVSSPNNNVVVVFSNDDATTKVSIKNFRGETIFSDSNQGTFVPLTIDDSLASILLQGFYHVDIYQITNKSTRLVRRIPLSIGNTRQDPKPPSFPNNSHCSDNKGFATDNTLNLKNGVLSVNVSEKCQPGGTLPISSNAVFEYAQPRNIIVEADLTNNTATMSSNDIYNYIMFGGNVLCLVNGLYLSFLSGTIDNATFKALLLDGNVIRSYLLTIDNVGKIINYKEDSSPINSSVDITNFKETLIQQMNELSSLHNSDIERMNSSILEMNTSVQSIKEQVGDLKVTEKITELYNNHNVINSKLHEVNTVLESKVSESEVATIVNQKVIEEISPEKLQELVDKSINENMKLDGGVVE